MPLVLEGEENAANRITREQYSEMMKTAGAVAFINKAVIMPFEAALEASDLEKLCCESFDVCVKVKQGRQSTSWKNVCEQLKNFLEIRADDSRTATQQNVKNVSGIGYCIEVKSLIMHINKLVDKETKIPGPSRKVEWPKLEEKSYSHELVLPAINYRDPTKDAACAVWRAKYFIEGFNMNVVKLFSQELQRWFYENTGYRKPDNIPDKNIGFIERTLEIEQGSYIQIQLVPEETPKYQEIIKQVTQELLYIAQDKPSQKFRNTKQYDGRYVNINSVYAFLQRENLAQAGLIKTDARYDIVP